MTLLRALVVGCGDVGSGYDEGRSGSPPLSHAGAYAANPDLELVGGVDPSLEARRRFEARWGCPCVPSLDEVPDRIGSVDVASMATPPTDRLDVLRSMVALGCRAVWCEKPMATSTAFARELAELASTARVGLLVNFIRRFDPVHRRVAGWVEAETPVHVDVRCTGGLANYGSHALDLVLWWLGGVDEVSAVAGSDGGLVAALRGPGGTGSVGLVGHEGADVFDVHVWTRSRRVTLSRNGEALAVGSPEPSRLWPTYRSLGPDTMVHDDGLAGAMAVAAAEVVELARRGTPAACGAVDGIAALELEEAIGAAVGGAPRRMQLP